ncbi:proton channel OtopLc-like isoform X1 [Dermatophagoides pteronyssinus]|uniref:proton channel OtopLc-like isoform X1 n=1 Tax=Dermatophagoides pteronyssinus TaxID=6956 RepID=UPI003F67D55A
MSSKLFSSNQKHESNNINYDNNSHHHHQHRHSNRNQRSSASSETSLISAITNCSSSDNTGYHNRIYNDNQRQSNGHHYQLSDDHNGYQNDHNYHSSHHHHHHQQHHNVHKNENHNNNINNNDNNETTKNSNKIDMMLTRSISTIILSQSASKNSVYLPKNSKTAAFIVTSSIYGQLLVVICIALFTAKIVSPVLPLWYFEAFYLYLYAFSLLFLFYVYIYLLNDVPKLDTFHIKHYEGKNHKIGETDRSHASIFLRIGSIVFGLGVMIYNGLEFGAYFEISPDSSCHSILLGVNPILQAAFTFSQMYFIFTYSRLMINKFKLIARIGLMHLVATNICVWIRTLGKEALHELKSNSSNVFTKPESSLFLNDFAANTKSNVLSSSVGNNTINQISHTINSTYFQCQNENVMGSILLNASPYLYPFIVEYSLIAAAFLYIMWSSIGKKFMLSYEADMTDSSTSCQHHHHHHHSHQHHHHNQMQIDDLSSSSRTSSYQNLSALYSCLGSSKGLFTGFLFLAISVTSLIIFFVLVHHPNYNLMASLLSDISHSILLILSSFAILIGFFKMRNLKFLPAMRDTADGGLRDLLLRIAAFGLYAYSLFGVIASSFELNSLQHITVLITSILTIVQVTLQTLFISDVVCRKRTGQKQSGRQLITFLLITNLTLWIVYTFVMQKLEASPIQLKVFGFTTWTLILRITLPLSIFYRFHSAITFAEVWKNSYKTSTSSSVSSSSTN